MRFCLLLLTAFTLSACGGGVFTDIASWGWAGRYDLSKSDLSDPHKVPQIAQALSDSNPKTRLQAISCLEQMREDAHPAAPQLARAALLDSNRSVRRHAMAALLQAGYSAKDILPALGEALHSSEGQYQLEALVFLLKEGVDPGYRRILSRVRTLAASSRNSRIKKRAAKVIAEYRKQGIS